MCIAYSIEKQQSNPFPFFIIQLGGIVKPNDGLCHMDREGSYTHSTTQDYPSVSQINQKVKENSVNLIFAVTKEQFHIYDQLGKHVEGAGCGVLSNDSSNIVELVQEQYNVSIPFLSVLSYLILNCSNSYFSKTEVDKNFFSFVYIYVL